MLAQASYLLSYHPTYYPILNEPIAPIPNNTEWTQYEGCNLESLRSHSLGFPHPRCKWDEGGGRRGLTREEEQPTNDDDTMKGPLSCRSAAFQKLHRWYLTRMWSMESNCLPTTGVASTPKWTASCFMFPQHVLRLHGRILTLALGSLTLT